MKTMEINELISKLKEYDGELTVKVWSNGAEKPYPISNVAAGTMCAYIGIDDRNLVDLSKVWHDASEEPEYNCKQILYQEKYGTYRIIVKHDMVLLGISWEDFLAAHSMSKWAYVDDLLPKGGEI